MYSASISVVEDGLLVVVGVVDIVVDSVVVVVMGSVVVITGGGFVELGLNIISGLPV